MSGKVTTYASARQSVHLLRHDYSGAGAEPVDRARHSRPWPVGAHPGVHVGMFADHLPLYRQSVIYARECVELERALLADWVGAVSALLRPLVDAVRRQVLAERKLRMLTTPIPALAPGDGKQANAKFPPPFQYHVDVGPVRHLPLETDMSASHSAAPKWRLNSTG